MQIRQREAESTSQMPAALGDDRPVGFEAKGSARIGSWEELTRLTALLAMPDPVKVMSYSLRGHVNRGAYDQPYSGVGIEFDPLGVRDR
jgi:hypothetical protein